MKALRGALRRLPSDERGVVLIVTALGLTVFLGVAALALDLGALYTARAESQRVADGAALAGAAMLVQAPGDVAAARNEAKVYAAHNTVRGEPVVLRDEDIEVLLNEHKVRVWVHHTAARGNPLPTVFARILGFDFVDVVTRAAAEAVSAGAAHCPLPLALPDRWDDTPSGDGLWTPEAGDRYVPWDPNAGWKEGDPVDWTGYWQGDRGLRMEIKAQEDPGKRSSDGTASPCVSHASWRCWFQPDREVGGGVGTIDPWIRGCPNPDLVFNHGDILRGSGAGNKQSLVTDAFVDLVAQDPDAYWDESAGCVKRSIGGACVSDSPRMRLMPVVDPSRIVEGSAHSTAEIANFVGVFVEKVASSPTGAHRSGPPGRWNVYAIFMGQLGSSAVRSEGSMVKVLRLVE